MIKLSAKTIVSNVIYKTIDIWKSKLPEQSLDNYDNWKEDLVEGICSLLEKKGINIDEVLIMEEDKSEVK
jgi:hypothetical protein